MPVRNTKSVPDVCCETTNAMFSDMLSVSLIKELLVSQVTVLDYEDVFKVSGIFVDHIVGLDYCRITSVHSRCNLANDYLDPGI